MADPGTTTTATLSPDLPQAYIRAELLQIAEKNAVMVDLGDEIPMPENEGMVIQATRYERLALPTQPLSEGVTPVATPLQVSTVQAVLDEWGMLVGLTNRGIITVKHPVIQVAKDRLGTAGTELWDREIQKTLMGGSNVTFPNGRTARSQLVAGDTLTADLVRLIESTLAQNGAPRYPGNAFVAVCNPFVKNDIIRENLFTQTHVYRETTALFNAEIGMWLGFRWVVSNLLPIFSLMAGGDLTIPGGGGAVAGGETGYAIGTSVPVVVTRLDPQSGYETVISAVTTVTNGGAAFSASVTIAAGAASGTYNIYVGLENATIATLQTQVTHVTGTGQTFLFLKAGTPAAGTHFITQATGPVAPPAPPASGGGSTGNVHVSYFLGKSAFGVTRIGPRLGVTLTPNVATDSDPLRQRRKAGFLNMFKALWQNTNFGQRAESLSAFN